MSGIAHEQELQHIVNPELLPDAPWKKIQQNTFTRWVNKHLANMNSQVYDLETDLSDGLQLIRLVEVLSGRQLGKYNKKVNFRSHKLENVTLALRFLENEEKIKIISIDSSHIVDQNLKLILGLIWHLILHYSISHAWEDLPAHFNAEEATPKQRLLAWIRSKLPPDVPVTNFTSDWNDAIALGALVDALCPGLDLNWREWEPEEALENTRKAMELAKENLGVVELITPEELINPNVDEKSVMTYLSQFPMAKFRPASGRLSDLDDKPTVGTKSSFKVHLAKETSSPYVTVIDPESKQLPVKLDKSSNLVYDATYTPEVAGKHQIALNITDQITQDSHRLTPVHVEAVEGARLSGFSKSGVVGEETHFRVVNVSDHGPVEVAVIDSKGHEIHVPTEYDRSTNSYKVAYIPETVGLHSVNVFHNKKHIAGSPFPFRALPLASDLKIWGRGLCGDGVRVGDKVLIHVVCGQQDPYKVPLEVSIKAPDGRSLPYDETIEGNTKTFAYTPMFQGPHQVELKSHGNHVGRSPYQVNVNPKTKSKIRAFGPGLEGGVAHHPAIFYVETHGDTDQLAFSVEGPSEAPINCQDNGDDSAIVQYTPDLPGEYTINVLSKGEHIKDSPFVVMIDPENPSLRPSLVRVEGLDQSLESTPFNPVKFRVDPSDAGHVVPKISIRDPEHEIIPHKAHLDDTTGVYHCEFTPTQVGKHNVGVAVSGVAVPGSPYPVHVREPIDLSKLRIYGPGVENNVRCKQPTHFFIDAKQAGSGEVEVALADREGNAVDIDVLDNKDGSFTVKYTAPKPGAYQLNVVFAGKEIPKIEINVKPSVDLSGVRVEGLENAIVTVNTEKEVHVFTPDSDSTRIVIKSPSGQIVEAIIESTPTGLRVRFTPSEIGDYTIDVTYEDIPVDASPFLLHSVPDMRDPRACCSEAEYQVTASEDVLIGTRKKITVDLGHVELPSSQSLQLISSEPDGKDYLVPLKPLGQTSIYEGLWTAIGEGTTTFKLLLDGDVIKESVTHVRKGQDASKVRAYGEGLEKAVVGELAKFQVDTQGAGDGGIAFEITGPSESKTHVTDNANGSCSFEYLPLTPGQYTISIMYGDARRHIPGSPFSALVDYRQDNSKVVVEGPGIEKRVRVGKPTHFFVDASKTAAGKVNARIPMAGHPQPLIEEMNPRMYKVTYTPTGEPGSLLPLEVFYEDQHVGRSPYRVTLKPMVEPELVKIIDPTGKYPSEVVASLKNHFVMDISEAGHVQSLQAGISGLDGVERKCEIVPSNDPYKYHLEWVPDTAGWYDCVVSCDGMPVTSHPIRVKAMPTGDAQKCKILDIPKAQHWKTLTKHDIMVDCTQAGAGDLILREDRPSELEITKSKPRAGDENIQLFSVKPLAVGMHNLKLLYGGVEIPNGAVQFEAVTDLPASPLPYQNGKGGHRESIDTLGSTPSIEKDNILAKTPDMLETPYDRRPSTSNGGGPVAKYPSLDQNGGFELGQYPIMYDERLFMLDLQKSVKEPKKLYAYVERPDAVKEQVVLVDNKDGTVSVSYLPTIKGDHTLNVLYDGKPLQGSKIHFEVVPGVISVFGDGLVNAKVGEPAHFTVNAKGSPVKQLSIAIEGLSKAKIECIDNKDGTCSVAWIPNDPGEYRINVRLAGQHVGGSPFTAIAIPGDRQRAQLSLGSVSEVSLNVLDDIKKLTATIRSPSGLEEICPVRRIDASRIGVSFTPREVGEHLITVKKKGEHIPASPFKIKVSRDQVGDASKVVVSGAGVSRAVCNRENEVLVDTRNAGYGGLSAVVEGPSKVSMTCSETQDGVIRIGYTPTEPGMYNIALKWADQSVKHSPFIVNCIAEDDSIVRESALKKADKVKFAKVHQLAELFLLMPNMNSSDLKARLYDPDGHKEKVDLKNLGDDYYQLSFKPKKEGIYKVSVTYKDQQVNGSPFQFTVGHFEHGGSSKINAYGAGLINGAVDQTQSFNIYSREAGPGNLIVNIDGPSKANIDFRDQKDGNCHVSYTVSEPGDYLVRVKFNDQEIPSSPFKVFIAPSERRLSSSPKDKTPEKLTKTLEKDHRELEMLAYKGDASKVVAKGSGLTKFVPGKAAMFTIDTSAAGSNLLFVGVVTTKGPCEEVIVKHHGQGNYIVNYKIHERAKAYIFVKYGEEQIPGSPFCIEP